MGWEQRGDGAYYYRKTRKGKRVCSMYIGSGWIGELTREVDQNEQEIRKEKHQVKKAERQAEAEIDRKLADTEKTVATIKDSTLHVAGFHKHKGQWRKKVMKAKQMPEKTKSPAQEINALQQRIGSTKKPSTEDVDRLRHLLVENPGLLQNALSVMRVVREQMIEKMCYGITRAHVMAEEDRLKKELGYDYAPDIERLLIDQIMMARIRVVYVENLYNQIVVNESHSQESGRYWEAMLSKTQNRFLRAVESLARVRKLARSTPALQINIAGSGGQQVNVQGE